METLIKVKIDHSYGNERIYPVSHVNTLLKLTKSKTLSREHITALKEFGCVFKVIVNKSI